MSLLVYHIDKKEALDSDGFSTILEFSKWVCIMLHSTLSILGKKQQASLNSGDGVALRSLSNGSLNHLKSTGEKHSIHFFSGNPFLFRACPQRDENGKMTKGI